MANVLVTRGDLAGAMGLYEQSLAIKESLGDVKGKSATLHQMANVLVTRGDLAGAMGLYEQSLAIQESLGDVKGKSATLVMLAQLQFARGDHELALSNARESLRLLRAMGAGPDAAQVEQIIQQMEAAMAGGGGAGASGAPADELAAREAQIAALRQAGDDRDTLVQLGIALYNLAMAYARQGDAAAAVPLLEEVVALDERTGHEDLESDRAALEQMRRRAAGAPEPGLREVVAAWVEGGRDADQFAALLNRICNQYVQVMQAGSQEQQDALADDLAQVRAARPLPIAGANDFLFILQCLLRGEPELVAQATQQRAALPAPLADALHRMEQNISGEADAAPAEEPQPQSEERAAVEAMLGQLSPAQRAELAVVAQVVPLLLQALDLLRNPEVAITERARHAEGLERAAAQAAADEPEGSPWLVAASALSLVGTWLRGTPPDVAALPEPYCSLIQGATDE
jgi:hypothetical protein